MGADMLSLLLLLFVNGCGERDSLPCVDVVELNIVYAEDQMGSYAPRCQQVITWRWSGGELHVAEWMIAGDFFTQGERAYWVNGQELYGCRFRSVRKTHTLEDPEVLDRDELSPHDRVPYFK